MTTGFDQLLLPMSVENEKLVLGSVLLDYADTLPALLGVVETDDFAIEAHRRVWLAMQALQERGEPVDRVTVATELHRNGQLESVGGLAYLTTLDDGLPHVYNLEAYAGEVRRLGTCRRAIRALVSTAQRIAVDRSPESIAQAETLIRELNTEAAEKSGLSSLGDFVERYKGGLARFLRPEKIDGIATPWPSVNAFYGGFEPGKLVILAARTSVGKSAAAAQIAREVAARGRGVALFSLEMRNESCWSRMLMQITGIRRGPHTTAQEQRALNHAAGELAGYPLWLCDRTNLTVPALRATLQKHCKQSPVAMVVVDYLQLLRSSKRTSNRVEEVSDLSRALKLAAVETGACWLVLAQLNRAAETEAEPKLTNLRESGSIEQDADDVILLHMAEGDRLTMRQRNCAVPMKLIVAKQRDGRVGSRALTWNPQFVRIEDRSASEVHE